jgi:ribosomal protein S18 acetylase RimI-like enzyme
VLFTDIRFCTELDAARVLEVDRTSPHPWPAQTIARDLRNGAELTYLGAFAPRAFAPRAFAPRAFAPRAFATGEEEKLLGYAVLGSEKKNGLLMNVVVLPEYRRRGVGIQLVVAAAECASALAWPALVLRVRPSNRAALELYKDLGFVCGEKRERYYSNGEVAQQMSLKLPLLLEEQERR